MVSAASLRALRDSLPGTSVVGELGKTYTLERCIGQGGQGWVFRARAGDLVLVVKVLRPDATDSRSLRRFKRESALLREIVCPNIVRLHDHGAVRVRDPSSRALVALPFMVLEDVPGATLAQALAEQKQRGFAAPRVRSILCDMSNALRVVHERHVIHRDLKPSNVLLDSRDGVERAKVTDFGFARFADIAPLTTSIASGLTHGYAPPEQYEKGNPRVAVQTDIFSLATIVWEMLAGRPAFPVADNETAIQVVARMTSGARPSLVRDTAFLSSDLIRNPKALHALDDHLGRAMSAEPNARQASVGVLVAAVEPVLAVL